MDVKDGGRRLMATKLIAATVAVSGKPLQAELLAEMTRAGVETLRVKDDVGTNYGTVSVVGGKQRRATVVDEAAFLAWVERTRPDEVVRIVRPATAKAILDAATAAGDEVPVDPVTGEVIPGVEMREGEPYLTVRPTPLAKELMADTLAASGILALPSGTGEVADDGAAA
jgi:hypothetical protein